jgi:hypothetical protein
MRKRPSVAHRRRWRLCATRIQARSATYTPCPLSIAIFATFATFVRAMRELNAHQKLSAITGTLSAIRRNDCPRWTGICIIVRWPEIEKGKAAALNASRGAITKGTDWASGGGGLSWSACAVSRLSLTGIKAGMSLPSQT